MENDVAEEIGEVLFRGKILKIYKSCYYTTDRPAILLRENGIPFAKISVNLPREEFEKGEFPVKNWNENEEITPFLLEHTDLFEDTGNTVTTGFMEAPIWRFKNA